MLPFPALCLPIAPFLEVFAKIKWRCGRGAGLSPLRHLWERGHGVAGRGSEEGHKQSLAWTWQIPLSLLWFPFFSFWLFPSPSFLPLIGLRFFPLPLFSLFISLVCAPRSQSSALGSTLAPPCQKQHRPGKERGPEMGWGLGVSAGNSRSHWESSGYFALEVGSGWQRGSEQDHGA